MSELKPCIHEWSQSGVGYRATWACSKCGETIQNLLTVTQAGTTRPTLTPERVREVSAIVESRSGNATHREACRKLRDALLEEMGEL